MPCFPVSAGCRTLPGLSSQAYSWRIQSTKQNSTRTSPCIFSFFSAPRCKKYRSPRNSRRYPVPGIAGGFCFCVNVYCTIHYKFSSLASTASQQLKVSPFRSPSHPPSAFSFPQAWHFPSCAFCSCHCCQLRISSSWKNSFVE
uniref:Uncharacterized protein n=1 Tax=Escherichia coli TaxID=562 RepID=A0A385EMX2_ECOLX|nr:hypothetical protein pECSIC9_00023 [Escherichia coli]